MFKSKTRKNTVYGRNATNNARNINLRKSRKSITLGAFPNGNTVMLNPEEAAILARIEAKHNEPTNMKADVDKNTNLNNNIKRRLKARINWLYPEKNFRHFHNAK